MSEKLTWTVATRFSMLLYPHRQRWNPSDQNGGSIGFCSGRENEDQRQVREQSGVEAHPDDVPVLLDDILRCGSGEDVEIDDAADGCVGKGGQGL